MTINVPIVTSTCSVSVPTEVNLDPVNINSLPYSTLIEGKNFDMVFSNCKDKTLQMSVQTAQSMTSGIWSYFDSGDPDHTFYYYIKLPRDAEITGGGTSYLLSKVFALDNTRPVLIKPGSDNYTMSPTVDFFHQSSDTANVGSVISGSFTYNITYQ
ncbi:hypothetical protein CCF61_005370 [Salmonella enterica subsp. enterica serovar Glostrup]|nr:hypothetical protein [Salmonella enterica subsp. enterica serovar Glostrup]